MSPTYLDYNNYNELCILLLRNFTSVIYLYTGACDNGLYANSLIKSAHSKRWNISEKFNTAVGFLKIDKITGKYLRRRKKKSED